MNFIYLLGLVLLISLVLSVLSLRDYQGEKDRLRIKSEYEKARIKGGIVFSQDKGKKQTKHYSSYS